MPLLLALKEMYLWYEFPFPFKALCTDLFMSEEFTDVENVYFYILHFYLLSQLFLHFSTF